MSRSLKLPPRRNKITVERRLQVPMRDGTVLVADQYGNPVSGASVTFSDGGAGGTFNNPNPATTNASGIATQSYTLPAVQGPVTITASVAGVSNPAVFNETAQ